MRPKRRNKGQVSVPVDDEALAPVQSFYILVSEAPVDAEMVLRLVGGGGPHVVATEEEDVVLFVGWRQRILQWVAQLIVGHIRNFVGKESSAP